MKEVHVVIMVICIWMLGFAFIGLGVRYAVDHLWFANDNAP